MWGDAGTVDVSFSPWGSVSLTISPLPNGRLPSSQAGSLGAVTTIDGTSGGLTLVQFPSRDFVGQ